MISQNILTAFDEWLDTWPGNTGELKPSDSSRMPAANEAVVKDPPAAPERMTAHDFQIDSVAPEVSAQPAGKTPLQRVADAYYRHHFGCLHCIAAGQDPALDRCAVGLSLWQEYRQSVRGGSHD